jgi:hypothetical protein
MRFPACGVLPEFLSAPRGRVMVEILTILLTTSEEGR